MLACDAVKLVRHSEAPLLQADALAELAAILKIADRPSEARAAIEEAIALYDAKGNLVSAARCRNWADTLSAA
jgi:hypothetical protein